MDIHSSLSCNRPKLEKIQMITIDKSIYPYKGVLFRNKRKQLLQYESQNNHAKQKKANKKHICAFINSP